MSNVFDHPGFEESILYSDDDFEPYGFVSPQIASIADAFSIHSRRGSHTPDIEAAMLRRHET